MRKAPIPFGGLILVALSGCLAPDAVPGASGGGGQTTTTGTPTGGGGAGGASENPLSWARNYGIDAASDQRAWSVASGPDGAALVAGEFEGSFAVGTLTLPNTAGRDGFVFALDAAGKPRFLVGLVGTGDQRVRRALFTPGGGALLAGSFSNELSIGGQEIGQDPNGEDGFLIALDDKQVLKWTVRGTGPGRQAFESVVIADNGDAIVGGTFEGSMKIGDLTISGAGGGDRDLFVARITPAGEPVWAQSIGGKAPDLPFAAPSCLVAKGLGDTVFVAGTFAGTLQLEDDLGATGSTDMFIGKLDGAGNALWGRHMGAPGAEQRVASLSVGPADLALIAADLTGEVPFGQGITLTSQGQNPDAALIAYDPNGTIAWARRYGSAAVDRSAGATFLEGGDLLFAGQFRGAIEFAGETALLNTEAQSDNDDIFLTRLSPDLKPRWARSFGSDGDQVATSVAFSPQGNPLLAGWFHGTLDFGAGPLDAKNGTDVFVARFEK